MTTIEEIEKAITHLSREELVNFRAWYEEFEAKIWDEQFEKDVKAGKLDKLAEKTIKDLHEGKCTEL